MFREERCLDYIYYEGIPKASVLNGIMDLHEHVFEESQLREEKLAEKENLIIFVACDRERVVGFKIGYKYSSDTFYSWLGGVHTDYRGNGIASELMRRQHALIKSLGYINVRTISRNIKREMLILNIKFGFNVIETFVSEKGKHKIVLEKEL